MTELHSERSREYRSKQLPCRLDNRLWHVVCGLENSPSYEVNTGTTIMTFLMVFLIQRAPNKDSRALHLKLNELLAVLDGASNRLLKVEDLSDDHRHFATLARLAIDDNELTLTHSVEEAERRHKAKGRGRPKQPKSA